MFQFMVGSAQREIVVRRDRRTKLNFADRVLEYELVSADTSGEFEVLSLAMNPGGVDRRRRRPAMPARNARSS